MKKTSVLKRVMGWHAGFWLKKTWSFAEICIFWLYFFIAAGRPNGYWLVSLIILSIFVIMYSVVSHWSDLYEDKE